MLFKVCIKRFRWALIFLILALGRLGLVYALFAFGDLRKRAALFLKTGVYTRLTLLHELQDGLVQEFIKQKQQKEEADYGENKL